MDSVTDDSDVALIEEFIDDNDFDDDYGRNNDEIDNLVSPDASHGDHGST